MAPTKKQRFYTLETFNACAREGFLMDTLDAWEGVHPGIATLPMDWDYSVPYGAAFRLMMSCS